LEGLKVVLGKWEAGDGMKINPEQSQITQKSGRETYLM
jgi:hypothetical protein